MQSAGQHADNLPEKLAIIQSRKARGWSILRPLYQDDPVEQWLKALQSTTFRRMKQPLVELALMHGTGMSAQLRPGKDAFWSTAIQDGQT